MARRNINLSTGSSFYGAAVQENCFLWRFGLGGFEKKIAGDLASYWFSMAQIRFWKRREMSRSCSVISSVKERNYDMYWV